MSMNSELEASIESIIYGMIAENWRKYICIHEVCRGYRCPLETLGSKNSGLLVFLQDRKGSATGLAY